MTTTSTATTMTSTATTMTGMTTRTARPAPPRRIRPGIAVRHGLTLAWRNITQLKHSPEKLADVTLMPIVFMLLFLYVFGGAVAGSTHAYLQQLLPGLVAQTAMFASMGIGVALSEDIHKGVFDRFRSLPIARSAPLVGAVLGDTVRFGVTMVILFGFGSALGFRFHSDPLSLLAALVLAYVFYLAICWVSMAVGLLARSPQSVQGLAVLWVIPLSFGSSALMADTGTMPGWLQAWVRINPVSHLANAERALTVGGPAGTDVLYTLGWAAGLLAVTFPLAMWLYRRRV